MNSPREEAISVPVLSSSQVARVLVRDGILAPTLKAGLETTHQLNPLLKSERTGYNRALISALRRARRQEQALLNALATPGRLDAWLQRLSEFENDVQSSIQESPTRPTNHKETFTSRLATLKAETEAEIQRVLNALQKPSLRETAPSEVQTWLQNLQNRNPETGNGNIPLKHLIAVGFTYLPLGTSLNRAQIEALVSTLQTEKTRARAHSILASFAKEQPAADDPFELLATEKGYALAEASASFNHERWTKISEAIPVGIFPEAALHDAQHAENLRAWIGANSLSRTLGPRAVDVIDVLLESLLKKPFGTPISKNKLRQIIARASGVNVKKPSLIQATNASLSAIEEIPNQEIQLQKRKANDRRELNRAGGGRMNDDIYFLSAKAE